MKVELLALVAKIGSKIANPSSLSPLYRSLELGVSSIRACSEYGNIEISIDETGLQNPVLLDAAALMAVATSLPKDAQIVLKESGNRIEWTCGSAKGHWNIVQQEFKIPPIIHDNFPWTPPETFAKGLTLAASACQAATVSIGMFGMLIDPTPEGLILLSSNQSSLAAVLVDKTGFPGGKIVLRPPVPGVLSALLQACPNCKLDITPEGIFVEGTWLRAQLPLSPPLEHDVLAVLKKHDKAEQSAKIDSAALRKFLTRAKVLTDRHATPMVKMKVEAGKFILEQHGMASSSEEYFLAEGLPTTINYSSVSLPIDMLLVPLEHAEKLVLDYLTSYILVIRGSNPEFTYVIGGSAPAAE